MQGLHGIAHVRVGSFFALFWYKIKNSSYNLPVAEEAATSIKVYYESITFLENKIVCMLSFEGQKKSPKWSLVFYLLLTDNDKLLSQILSILLFALIGIALTSFSTFYNVFCLKKLYKM